ncbi:MAG: antibiotic acetyltransferase, partial [Planctomycetota bacterium]
SYGACFEPGAWPPGVVVGRYTSVAQGVRVFNQNHPLGWLSTHPFFYDPRLGVCRDNPLQRHTLHIGHDVWLGQNAIITPGCRRIGNGAVVGAGAVVTKDVEPFAIVAGNPARVLRKRFDDDTCASINAAGWWEKSINDVRPELEAMRAELDPVTHPLLTERGAP